MKYLRNGIAVEQPGPDMTVLPSGVPGVFETVLVRDGQPVFWSDHWRRFEPGADGYGLEAPFTSDELLDAATSVIAANAIRCGVLRYALWREGDVTWTLEVSSPRATMRKRELRATWGPALEISAATRAFKHLNRAAWAAAARQAQANGFDQPLVTDQVGNVVEGATANIFIVQDGVLHTPALECGPLPGILRAHVVAVAREARIGVCERPISRADVGAAAEVWLTNSLIGIRPLAALDTHHFGDNRPVLEQIRRAWLQRHGWDPTAPVSD